MSEREPRLSAQTLKVLAVVMSAPQEGLSGAQIGRESKLASGTLYPILLRLEQAQWLESHWEEGDPSVLGRPRRRFYQVTPLGAKKAKAAYQDLEPAFGRFVWS
jgi:PadR family transcriptional regulator, regulatory protein PadR